MKIFRFVSGTTAALALVAGLAVAEPAAARDRLSPGAAVAIGALGGLAVGAAVGAAVAILVDSSAVALGLLSSSALSLLGGLVLLALGGELLQDEGRQLLARVGLGDGTTSLAVHENALVLDANNSLGILATSAEDELVDEAVEVVLQLGSLMGSVDDPAVILGVVGGLGTEFETEVLDDV